MAFLLLRRVTMPPEAASPSKASDKELLVAGLWPWSEATQLLPAVFFKFKTTLSSFSAFSPLGVADNLADCFSNRDMEGRMRLPKGSASGCSSSSPSSCCWGGAAEECSVEEVQSSAALCRLSLTTGDLRGCSSSLKSKKKIDT